MAIRPILRMGHPLLRQSSRELTPAEIGSDMVNTLIQDLVETMHAASGLGIAAPQVGELVQLSVIEFTGDNSRYPNMGDQKRTVFINPRLQVLEAEVQGFWEGCLSVPDLRGLVFRPKKVAVDYLDEKGLSHYLVAEGFFATVLQHEFDHLDGVLYIDRVQDRTQLAFVDEYKEFILAQQPHGEVD